MGEVGNCYDNVFADRVIGTLKGEYRLADRFLDRSHAQYSAQQAICLYKADRPHLALDYACPQDVYLGVFTTAAAQPWLVIVRMASSAGLSRPVHASVKSVIQIR